MTSFWSALRSENRGSDGLIRGLIGVVFVSFLVCGVMSVGFTKELEPLEDSSLRKISGAQGLQLRFNLDLGDGDQSEIIVNDPESGGALYLEDFKANILLGRDADRGLEIDLDGGPTYTPFLQLTLPGGNSSRETRLQGTITSESILMDDLEGISESTLGGLFIGNRNGNKGDLHASGKFRIFETEAN